MINDLVAQAEKFYDISPDGEVLESQGDLGTPFDLISIIVGYDVTDNTSMEECPFDLSRLTYTAVREEMIQYNKRCKHTTDWWEFPVTLLACCTVGFELTPELSKYKLIPFSALCLVTATAYFTTAYSTNSKSIYPEYLSLEQALCCKSCELEEDIKHD
jgi:hypothetical protein